MLKFYVIPRDLLINRTPELIEWLEAQALTKRRKPKYIFGRDVPGTIAFTDQKLATLFVLKFGAKRNRREGEYGN